MSSNKIQNGVATEIYSQNSTTIRTPPSRPATNTTRLHICLQIHYQDYLLLFKFTTLGDKFEVNYATTGSFIEKEAKQRYIDFNSNKLDESR